MTWHSVTVRDEELRQLLDTIRRAGGVITNSRPTRGSYVVTYVL
jgi:hypothetical protein